MIKFSTYLITLLSFLLSIISYIPKLIFNYLSAELWAKATYKLIGARNQHRNDVEHVLEIGTATGGPLSVIVHNFKQAKILGIDENKNHVPVSQQLFKDYSNVEIKHMNFGQLAQGQTETLYDVIIFGSSFMDMPYQSKDLEKAKRKLNRNGKIYFQAQLYERDCFLLNLMDKIKPLLKYLFRIQFEKVTYRDEFEDFLKEQQMKVTYSQRCYGDFCRIFWKLYLYEVEKDC